MTFIRQKLRAVERLLTQPVSELTRAQWYARYTADLVRHCARVMRRDRAGQMAAALTYRTIFSLVPLAVLSLIVLRAVYDQATATDFLQGHILAALQMPAEEAVRVQEAIVNFTNTAYEVSGKGVGGVGIVVLIWAALAMAVTVEQCFNTVYNSPTGRPWYYRIPIYWATLTLGPVLIFVSLYLGAQLVAMVAQIPVVGSLLSWLTAFTPLAASWMLLFLLYTLMPNARVSLRPALVGSFLAALLYEAGKFGFKYYAANVSFTTIYGSLGLVPLFLFWIYITWMIVLFGLELSYTMQTLKSYQLRQEEDRQELQLITDARLMIPIMARIGRCFANGKTIDNQTLAQDLNLPIRTVMQMTERLRDKGLLNVVRHDLDEPPSFCLALPPDEIPIARLVSLSAEFAGDATDRRSNRPEWRLLESLTAAQCEAAGNATLASLINSASKSSVTDSNVATTPDALVQA